MATPSNRTDKILVVDDDARIRDLLRRYLTQEGFEVMVAEDGKALSRLLLRETVDLIVLDLMMPGEDGLSICRRLRAANDRTPIIMLTAKGEDVDRIVGLEVGADDYLGKPFNPRELLARIHAVLRRRPPQEAPGAPSGDNEVVNFGPFSFDLGTRALQKNGEELPLTTGEFAMLKALVRHPRQPLSREKLALLARGREFEPFDRSLDVQVSRLRKLIEEDAAALFFQRAHDGFAHHVHTADVQTDHAGCGDAAGRHFGVNVVGHVGGGAACGQVGVVAQDNAAAFVGHRIHSQVLLGQAGFGNVIQADAGQRCGVARAPAGVGIDLGHQLGHGAGTVAHHQRGLAPGGCDEFVTHHQHAVVAAHQIAFNQNVVAEAAGVVEPGHHSLAGGHVDRHAFALVAILWLDHDRAADFLGCQPGIFSTDNGAAFGHRH